MKFLIVIPEGMFTNTSSSIFSYNFISELSKEHIVDVIGYKLPDNYLFRCETSKTNVRKYIHLNSNLVLRSSPRKLKPDISSNSDSKNKTKALIKSVGKNIIPDYMSLGIIDITNLNEVALDNYDYILSMSDPKGAHFLGIYLKKKVNKLKKTKFLQFWGDPWYHDITRKTSFIDKLLESYILSQADLIFYRSQPTLTLQSKTYSKQANKMQFIHRGFSGRKVSNYSMSVPIKKVKFAYLGDFNPKIRDIETFCKVATGAGHYITIAGNSTPESISRIQSFPNLTFLGRLPPDSLKQIYQEADCIFIALNRTGTQIPGKIYDLIPLHKPIILLMDGDLTINDIPLKERFHTIQNNQADIAEFFLKKKSLEFHLDSKLNDMHISEIVKDFINQVSYIKDI